MTAPLPADFPIRLASGMCPSGAKSASMSPPSSPSPSVLGVSVRTLKFGAAARMKSYRAIPVAGIACSKRLSLKKKVRQTSAGRMHAVLVVGFFLLFLGTATATLGLGCWALCFGKQFLRGNVYLAYKLILDVAGAAVLVALAFAAWRRWGTANELPKDGRFVLAYASLAFICVLGYGSITLA